MGGGWTGPLLGGDQSAAVGPKEWGLLFLLGEGGFCLLPGSLAKAVGSTTAQYVLFPKELWGCFTRAWMTLGERHQLEKLMVFCDTE